MKLPEPWPAIRGRPVLAYGFALVATGVALLIRLQVAPALPAGYPYLTFFPAVILTTFLAGVGPGVLCAVASGVAAWWFFIPPAGFGLDGPTALALGFYAFIVGVDITLIHLARRAVERLRTEQGVSARLADQQRTMFQELQHRVANNLTFIAGLLQMQRRRVAASPDAAEAAFDEARRRLETMSRIHRRLYDPQAADLPLGAHLKALAADVAAVAGRPDVAVEVYAPEMRLELGRLVTLSLLLTEVMTNSLKHAFAGREGGAMRIQVQAAGVGRLSLTVEDDGPGWPDGSPPPAGPSLGLRIVQGLASQLHGTLTMGPAPGGGAQTRLEFPA